jgi:ribulose 1,5-bisphosphate carboxylase large subunit-like protein
MANNNEDRYVVPNASGGWDVVKEDHKRASGHFDTQKEAIERAREIVKNSGRGKGEVRIQGKNGQFRDSDSGTRNETSAKDRR